MTRYPRSGKGKKWTFAELKAIPVTWKGDSLSEPLLSGEVRVSKDGAVSVRFKYAFKWDGKVNWHDCKTWPGTSLEEVRANRDAARSALKLGVNPNDQRRAAEIEVQRELQATIAEAERLDSLEKTFGELFQHWITDGVARSDGNADIKRRFEKDVLPHLAKKLLRETAIADLNMVLRMQVSRGVNRTAVVTSRDLQQMFSWAEKRPPWRKLLADGNPAALLEVHKLVQPDYDLTNERSRTLSAAEVKELHDAFALINSAYESAPDRRSAVRPLKLQSQLAVWLCLGTACRIGELLLAKWEHVDLNSGTWFIPKENTKGTRGKKRDHHVALSSFALSKFKQLHEITQASDWCFPGKGLRDDHVDLKTITKQIADRQVQFKQRKQFKNRRLDNSLVLDGGRNGDWTPHDLRRTAATMMQALGVLPDVIDRCQNHVLAGSKVRRTYMRHDYAAETRQAWQLLGDSIESITTLNCLPELMSTGI